MLILLRALLLVVCLLGGVAAAEPAPLVLDAAPFALLSEGERARLMDFRMPLSSLLLSDEVVARAVGENSYWLILFLGAGASPVDPGTGLALHPDYVLVPAAPLEGAPDPLKVKAGSRSLSDFLGAERGRLLKFNADLRSPASGSRLTADGELAYRPFDPGRLDGFDDETRAPVRLGLKGSAGPFGYGASYQSVGKRLETLATAAMKKDREGTEVWAESRVGVGRLKASLSELSDNVDQDPRLPRTTKTQGGLTVEAAPSGWPVLGLSYAQGVADRVPLGGRPTARRAESDLETFGGSLYYGRSDWDVTLSTSYSPSIERHNGGRETITIAHDLSASYRPTGAITISPSLGLWEDRYLWSGVQNDTTAAALTLTYAPPSETVSLTAFGSYSRRRGSDGWTDGTAASATASVAWNLGLSLLSRSALSLELGYNRYVDAITPSSSYTDLSALVLFRVLRVR